MGVELGIWRGQYEQVTLPWLRWWDADGNLLLTGDERAQQAQARADLEHQLRLTAEAEIARLHALLLAAKQ